MQSAATTSLPERIGGSRNFDYRFAWVRDAGFAVDALTSLSLRPEVHAAVVYLLSSAAKTVPDVRVLYSIRGEVAPAEMGKVTLWQGYRGSSPVQVGNNAAKQRQLGAYGDLLECVRRYVAHGNVLGGSAARVVFRIADNVCDQGPETDAGIWELGDTQPYTSSKIGCWAALSRAAELADLGQVPGDHAERWRSTAKAIHDYVDTACWSEAKSSYAFYAGTDKLDCATLLAARTGFCAGDDPRLHSTIDAIRAELTAGGPLLYRYTGMREEEGAFLACSFWLVEALAVAGRHDEAREVMNAVAEANDVGLLSEEIDPHSRALLDNMPQALSHLALIQRRDDVRGRGVISRPPPPPRGSPVTRPGSRAGRRSMTPRGPRREPRQTSPAPAAAGREHGWSPEDTPDRLGPGTAASAVPRSPRDGRSG